MSKVTSGPEVHADGEIWAQTLWQIRQALGSAIAEKLITEGMEVSPPDPSFLDERNAILQADKLAYGGSHQTTLWNVFRNRGMGYFADTTSANDTTPVQNFSSPPSCPSACATVSGTITDTDTGAGISGAYVGIRGHDSGYAGDLAATTNSSGHYSIANVPTGHSYVIEIGKNGYLPTTSNVSVGSGGGTVNRPITRDWAANSGGANVTSFNGPDYSSYGCGPTGAIDLSQGSGWGSDMPGPRYAVIHLPQKINIRQLQIDPGATCGDPDSAGVGRFTIQTRTSASAGWTTAWDYTGSGLPEHTFSAHSPTTGKTGVSDVRLVMNNNRGNAQFIDMSELLVFGSPAGSTTTTHKLTVSKAGTGGGSVSSSPSGISCGTSCSHSYNAGTAVKLTASPASGSTFSGWSGGGCSGTGACTVTMNANQSVTATFKKKSSPPPSSAPNTAITKVKVNSKKKKAKITFTGSGGSGKLRFKCKLDKGSYSGCSSPTTYKHLKKGKHKVKVVAVDSTGKADPTPAGAKFKLSGGHHKHKHHKHHKHKRHHHRR